MPAIDEPVILLPVKGLGTSKTRLSPILSVGERAKLTLLLLWDVLECFEKYRNRFVVTSDGEVAAFARDHGSGVIESYFGDLNSDLAFARSRCTKEGGASVLYLLPDLPTLTRMDVDAMVGLEGKHPSTVVAPSKDGGTNALLLKPCDLIEPLFGTKSLERHLSRLMAVGVEPEIYSSMGTSFDLDTETDLMRLIELAQSTEKGRAVSYLLSLDLDGLKKKSNRFN